jgi:hypothetical protein
LQNKKIYDTLIIVKKILNIKQKITQTNTTMFYTQIINKIQKFISGLNIRQRANLILSGLLLFTTIAAGLTALTLLPNIDRAKTADAAPVCVGINTFYSTADSLCHERGGFIGVKCLDLSLPDSSNNCGYSTGILFGCGANIAGQMEVLNGTPDDKFCTLNTQYVLGASCIPRYFNNPGNLAANKSNMEQILSYSSNNVTWQDSNLAAGQPQTQSGQYWNDHFCKDFTSPCPAGWRIIAEAGVKYASTGSLNVNNVSLPVVCIQTNFADGTLFNSRPVHDIFFNVQNDQLDGNNTTAPNINLPRQGNETCYPSGYEYYGRMAFEGPGRSVICSKSTYQADIRYCDTGYTTVFTTPFAGCERTYAPTSCTLGKYINSVTTTCMQCPINTYCPQDASAPTNCPIDTIAPAGSGSCISSCVATPTPQCTANNASGFYSYVRYASSATGAESDTITASPGTSVYARLYYDNLTDAAINGAAVKTSLPAGFNYVSGSLKHCVVPTQNELSCDTQTPVVKDDMFSTLLNTGISTAATLYDGATGGALGSAATAATGIFDAGKKRFLNLDPCWYVNTGNSSASFSTLLTDPGSSFGSIANDASNAPITTSSCKLGVTSDPLFPRTQYKSYPIGYYNNFYLSQCKRLNNDTSNPLSYSGTVWTDNENYKAFSGASNSFTFPFANACTNTDPNYNINNDNSGYNRAQILGQRYLNLSQCQYNNTSYNRVTNLLNNTVNSTNGYNMASSFTATTSPITAYTCGVGGIGFTQELNFNKFKAIDMLDNTRARGFYEYRMTVPTAGTLPSYTQSVSLLGTPTTPVTQTGTINTGVAPTTCPAGQSLVSSACVVCPVNSYCTGGTAAAIPCTSPATTNGQTGSTAATACVTTAPTTCPAGQSLVSSACVVCPVNSYCTGGTAAAIPCTSPATTNGQTGSTAATACVTTAPTTCPAGQSLVSSACVVCPVNSYCTGGTAAAIPCTSPATTNGQTGSTAATACVTTCTSPNTTINNVCTPPTNNGNIGTSVATVTTPIATSLGSLMPIIPLTGNTFPDGTVATFTPAGSTTVITGTIVSGSFVPTTGQTLPLTATTGPATGVLTIGTTTLNIPTNFTPTTGTTTIGTPVATVTTPITGTVGDPAFNIPLVGSTIADGTIATFTLPGSTTAITGKIIAGIFVPDANQTIPVTGVTTGLSIGILKVENKIIGVPINFNPQSNFIPSIGTSIATATNPIGGAVGTRAPAILLSGNTHSNNTAATFTPNGTSDVITGKMINGNFIPNAGQLIPLSSTIGANTGVLKVGTLSLNIPTNFSAQLATPAAPGNGGTITICSPACQSTTSNNNNTATQTIPTTSTQTTAVAATPVSNSNNGVFKSKLRITDPYICGEGSYGNVPNPKAFGVDFVYYDFYKIGSTTPSYSYKLRLADNGDFFLPISKSSNVIKEGDYKVVFYAYDNEGNKAQGDYTDFITDNCANSNVGRSATATAIYNKLNGLSAQINVNTANGSTTIRSGGLEILSTITMITSLSAAVYLYRKSKSKAKLGLKM